MNKIVCSLAFTAISVFALSACQPAQETPLPAIEDKQEFNVEFEKFTLDNGLDVVFHLDRSDPVVAVALTVHVGSAREKQQRTGFAHLFEHLLFLESENLGKGGLDQLSARIGGSGANGSTSRDRTNYFQTVPKDALEKMIWAEADKLGWFINTVTEPVLEKEKQVVKNEKRQRVDNQPYGHSFYVLNKLLYPESHPYNWQVIGSLDDLQAATLGDVKEFFKQWYVPNNTTLVLAGDFDPAQAKQWVKKYFDEIPRGGEISRLPKQAVKLDEVKRVYHEDNFARLPEMTMVWPTVENYHPDAYALDVLANYLSEGKEAPLYRSLIKDKKLTSRVRMFNFTSELAGQFHLSVRAYENTQLDSVYAAVQETFDGFAQTGISQEDLDRIKAGQETEFYQSLSSVLGKGFQLAQYNIFADDPGFVEKDITNILNVTTEDVMRVFNQYIHKKHYVAASFVPKGQVALALANSDKASVVEEQIIEGAEQAVDASVVATYTPTPSSFDRSVEPPYGDVPKIITPTVWQSALGNGLQVYGIENSEVPLVEANMVLSGGMLLDPTDKVGVANLLAEMLTLGTKQKTAAEFEAATKQLGASIDATAASDRIVIQVSALKKNYQQTMALVNEMLLQPRWDAEEFELTKKRVITTLKQQVANPNAIAQNHFNKLLYPDDIRGNNPLGSIESVEAITLNDLQEYFSASLSPTLTDMLVVGDISENDVLTSLQTLKSDWLAKDVILPELGMPDAPQESRVYFYDVPKAKQSVLRIGYPALRATDEDYYAASVMNYRLGGGSFASQLTQQLREGKGYTYGIFSRFNGTENSGAFSISSGVRTNVTYESTALIKQILEQYPLEFNESDLTTTKSFLIKSSARSFETARSKLNMLRNISQYGYPNDYAAIQQNQVENMTVDKVKALAGQYANPNKMIWLVVGDKETQLAGLEALGFGKPVLLN